eukprot:11388063-Heterocapsa_arctica.AAC.1
MATGYENMYENKHATTGGNTVFPYPFQGFVFRPVSKGMKQGYENGYENAMVWYCAPVRETL